MSTRVVLGICSRLWVIFSERDSWYWHQTEMFRVYLERSFHYFMGFDTFKIWFHYFTQLFSILWDFAIFDAIILWVLTSLFIACHTAIPALSLDVSGEAQQKATRWASMMICFWDDHSSRGRSFLSVLQMAYHTMWPPPVIRWFITPINHSYKMLFISIMNHKQ